MVLGEDQIRLLRQVVSQLYLHQSPGGAVETQIAGPLPSEALIQEVWGRALHV